VTFQTQSIELFNINLKGRRFCTQFVFLKPLLWTLSCMKRLTYGLISNLWILKFINIQNKNCILNMRKHCVTITKGCLMTFRELNSHRYTAIVRIHTMHIFYVQKKQFLNTLKGLKLRKFLHSPNTWNSSYVWAKSINQSISKRAIKDKRRNPMKHLHLLMLQSHCWGRQEL